MEIIRLSDPVAYFVEGCHSDALRTHICGPYDHGVSESQ